MSVVARPRIDPVIAPDEVRSKALLGAVLIQAVRDYVSGDRQLGDDVTQFLRGPFGGWVAAELGLSAHDLLERMQTTPEAQLLEELNHNRWRWAYFRRGTS